MSFEFTLRLMEVMLGLAIAQQSLEHIIPDHLNALHRMIFVLRLALALALAAGFGAPWAIYGLWVVALWMLHRFQGPYNGGSDKMTLLILSCLCLVELAPDRFWQEMAISYLAVQLVLSYFVSGWVKVWNPIWRSGSALNDVFRYSAYPVSEGLRAWADRPTVLLALGWAVIILELAFPLALLDPLLLKLALFCTAAFHFSNACFFGLNRFFWIWICAYPALIWFQGRVVTGF